MLQIVLLLIPFIELGVSYYASIAMILSVVVLLHLRSSVIVGCVRHIYLLPIVLLMFLSLNTYQSSDFGQDVARIIREAVIFYLIVSVLRQINLDPFETDVRSLIKPALVIVCFFLLVVVVQFYALQGGRYIGFPASAFSSDTGTVPEADDLYYGRFGQGALRPNATFTEPSYLGFILLSFVVMFLPALRSSKQVVALILVSTVTGLLINSAAFVFGLLIVAGVPLFWRGTVAGKLWFVAAFIVLVFLFLAITDTSGAFDRLLAGTSSNGDYSTFVRIFGPLQIIPEFLMRYPWGVPFYGLIRTLAGLNPDSAVAPAEFINNGIFNMLFEYGFIGFVLLGVLLKFSSSLTIALYLVMSGMFNGAFLSIDKLAVILLTAIVHQGSKSWAADRTTPSVADEEWAMI